MKKISIVLSILTLLLTLTACNKNLYTGEIKYFEDSEIHSYSMNVASFGDALIKYENNKIHTSLDGYNYYAYAQNNQYIEVNMDDEGMYFGIILEEEADFTIFENLFAHMDAEASFSDYTQDKTTNRFYYEDGQGLFEIWLNEDNYIIELKVTNIQTSEITFHIYDINDTSVTIPTHNIYRPYEYVLNVYFDFEGLYIEDDNYLYFDDSTFTIKVKIDGTEVHYIDSQGDTWEYQLNGLIGFKNEAGIHYTLTEFTNLYPTFDEDYLDQILAIAAAIYNPSSIFQ